MDRGGATGTSSVPGSLRPGVLNGLQSYSSADASDATVRSRAGLTRKATGSTGVAA